MYKSTRAKKNEKMAGFIVESLYYHKILNLKMCIYIKSTLESLAA